MAIKDRRIEFEKNNNSYNSEILKFEGVGNNTVYNCSTPFDYKGETFIFGRVEKKELWANSNSVLFKLCDDGIYRADFRFLPFGLEDPFLSKLNGEYILGGNIIFRGRNGKDNEFKTLFYRGQDPFNWYHFTCGPLMMKDIRLVQLPEGKIGVFSRPRSSKIKEKYGYETLIGFTIIDNIDQLDEEVIENAPYIDGFFEKDEWGGVNQAFYLGDNKIGIIGHQCYSNIGVGIEEPCYLNSAYVYDMITNQIIMKKIIATRKSYPETDAKIIQHYDAAFTSGIVFKKDGTVDLYSGLCDMYEGKKVIENPFKGYISEDCIIENL